MNVVFGQTHKNFPVRVSSTGRYFVDRNGAAIWLHGDTAWSLAVACTRDQITHYLDDRKQRGFNAILVNLIEHYFNSSPAYRNAEGNDPFTTMSPVSWNSPNTNYWGLVDFLIDAAIGTYAASGTRSMTHPGNNAAGASDWVLRLDSVA